MPKLYESDVNVKKLIEFILWELLDQILPYLFE